MMISPSAEASTIWPFARPLYDIANVLESGTESDARLRRVLEILGQVVPYDRCALLDAEPGIERRIILSPEPDLRGEQGEMLDLLGKLLGLLSDHHIRSATRADASFKMWDAHLAVPLVGLDQVIGVLFMGRNGAPYSERDLCVLSVVAAQTATYLTTLRLQREERRARQAAEEANRAKDEFMAMVSHEIRTPLTAILGWAHLLGAGSLGEAGRVRAIETITRNATAQSRIIEDLLDLSRIITGKLRIDPRPVDLGAVLDAAIAGARLQAEAKTITLESTRDPGEIEVLGDPDRLQQVLSNLLGNAIKFTAGGGRISVQVERGPTSVRVAVRDTGRGISPALLPSIFARYRQADGSSRRGHDGLGLGLAIVQSLVELHGGQVQAESPGEGAGSTFTVVLPLSRGKATVPTTEDAIAHLPDGSRALQALRVLLIDDDADAGDVLRTMLEHYGAEVTLVSSVSEALAALSRALPDVLLSDLSMLSDGGQELTQKATALAAARGARLPVAALTADATSADRDQALASGFQMHLTKPIAPARLAAAVAHLARSR